MLDRHDHDHRGEHNSRHLPEPAKQYGAGKQQGRRVD